jgi:Flp pilus assembly protein TadG
MPLVCLLLTLLLGGAAVAIDLGRMYYAATELQAVADASALAAARGWQRYPDIGAHAAWVYVQDVAPRNRVGGAAARVNAADVVPITYNPATRVVAAAGWANNSGVQVTVRAQVPYVFAGALGLTARTLSRSAVAWAASVNGASCVRPFFPPYTRNYEAGITKAATWSSQGQNVPDDPSYWYNFAGIASLQPDPPHNNPPVGRTYVNLPPWEKESDWDTNQRYTTGNWRPADLTGGGLADYRRLVAAPVGSVDCRGVTVKLDDLDRPLSYPTRDALLAEMRVGMDAICNRVAFAKSATDAYCYDEKGRVGAPVRVAFADVTPPPSGTTLWVREVTQIRIVCYFRSTSDVCRDTYIQDGYGRTSTFTMPGPYNSGYPAGTMATLLDGPVSMNLTSDVVLGSKPGITQRLMLVR